MTFPLLSRVHICRRCRRSLFAIVEEGRLPGMKADQHEASTAKIARRRMYHRQRKSRRHPRHRQRCRLPG